MCGHSVQIQPLYNSPTLKSFAFLFWSVSGSQVKPQPLRGYQRQASLSVPDPWRPGLLVWVTMSPCGGGPSTCVSSTTLFPLQQANSSFSQRMWDFRQTQGAKWEQNFKPKSAHGCASPALSGTAPPAVSWPASRWNLKKNLKIIS